MADLLTAGKLRLTDADQRRAYWTIPVPLIRYYAATGQVRPRPTPEELKKMLDDEMKRPS